MLSYRKSQQASLTEKLKKKNVIHVFGASGSGTTMARLCLSAFARVATAGHQRTCGHGLFKVVNNGTRNEGISALAGMEHFASAHSRGLRLGLAVKLPCRYWLCLSAFVRVATMIFTAYSNLHTSLPQRIRAGCDAADRLPAGGSHRSLPQRIRAGCDFDSASSSRRKHRFATAHSCGLRPSHSCLTLHGILDLPQRIRAGCDAHLILHSPQLKNLPQRIRAGCDAYGAVENAGRMICHSAFVRVAT